MVKASEKLTRILIDCTQPGQNADLQQKYKVQGYPTILFLDVDGNPLESERHEALCPKCQDRYILSGAGNAPPCPKCGGPLKDQISKGPLELMGREPEAVRRQFEEVSAKSGRPTRWHDSVAAGMEAARTTSRPVAVLFTDQKPASEAYLKALEDKLLEDLFDKVVFVKLDLKKDEAEAKKFRATTAPVIYLIDPALEKPEAKPLARIAGTKTAKDLRKDLDEALKKAEKK